ncbi:TRM11 family SAM-dependent methyltransferase [Methanococcoides burtonii]|uniref:tRNA (guanine(10)-N(2))-dimethyltransferase n=1 Tax=Methanococcoides burtonii (strain DSM 6242 / NBRC 107633 / OCM 468 / ACE-M) TaxID=259564 RepID=Q12VJ9_METBU|nr:TRM11 family methyltransferase [Methanococcoides burtonii]ABE52527.1 Nucleic acid binding protein [Methanococcoides burtonii DSM 6242]
MLYAFELSGEHEDLPRAEVLACLDLVELEYGESEYFEHCLVADIKGEPQEILHKLREVAKRIAMTHYILKVIDVCPTEIEDIIEVAEGCDISEHLNEGQKYVVRAKRVRHNTTIKCVDIERRVGGAIYRKGFNADLKDPDVEFRAILSEKCVLGSVIASVDRSAYEARAPHKKPFFYPGVLRPRVARALVNMALIKEGDVVFDPFCGTAGILVEAGLVGATVLGLEVRYKIAVGADMNLRHFNADQTMMMGDACKVPLVDESVDAVIADPPYGRSARIEGESLHHLYEHSFAEMFRVLKPGKLAIIVSEIDVTELVEKVGFTIKDRFLQRVHKSLTRKITVLQK